MIEGSIEELRKESAVVVDRVAAQNKLASSKGPMEIGEIFEINDRRARVVGLCQTTRTFASQPLIYTTYERALSYAPSVLNGMIPFVQSVATGPNKTLFIISYKGARNSSQTQYIVVPVEQILSVVYSTRTIATTGFTVTPPTGMIPYFPINLPLRAEDIQNVVATLVTSAPYATPISSVAIQTTLDGPFYPTITDGLIPDVQNISLAASPNETLLLVNFIGPYNQLASVVVAVDQVEQVIYYPN